MIIRRVTLLGHKDHGKSTLIGNLSILTGSVTEARIKDAKKTSEKLGLNFEPGFILDSFYEEREGGMTIDTTRAQVKYNDNAFEFIDVPGHEELTKNMISGASYADAALLMVSTKEDEGIKTQTKRHLFIAKMLGIERVVVAVNKMDLAEYKKEKFDEIKEELSTYLTNIGFDIKNIAFVPISAYTGEGLTKNSENMQWYKGDSLIETLIKFSGKKKTSSGELVVLLQGELEDNKKILTGKVISGSLLINSKVKMLPSNEELSVKQIIVRGKNVKKAVKDENVALVVENTVSGNIRGSIILSKNNTKEISREIQATIFFLRNMKGRVSLLINGSRVNCKSIQIGKIIDIKTGKETKGSDIKPLGASKALIKLENKIFVDKFNSVPELGRFAIYDNDKFSGIGIIEAVK
ncbi:MAG: GTP-binding protein [Candidatus Micrarchaeaceae archaeon]